jgi:hypothetical protein
MKKTAERYWESIWSTVQKTWGHSILGEGHRIRKGGCSVFKSEVFQAQNDYQPKKGHLGHVKDSRGNIGVLSNWNFLSDGTPIKLQVSQLPSFQV